MKKTSRLDAKNLGILIEIDRHSSKVIENDAEIQSYV